MLVKRLVVTDPLGLHLGAAARFAKTASCYKSRITVKYSNGEADGKSLMELLALSIAGGSRISIELEGPDAGEAREALAGLFLEPGRAHGHAHSARSA